jgi:oxygen-independent coproporphyrinogen-3 oxidase
LENYEVSNFAKSGSESRHNILYWTAGDYAGIGPGAHGRLTIDGQRWATEAYRTPTAWLENVAVGSGDSAVSALSNEEQGLEYLLMGLRLSRGLSGARYERISGKPLVPHKLAAMTELGMIVVDGDQIFTTPKGQMLLNQVIQELAD